MPSTNRMKIPVWKIALFGGLLAFSALFWLNDHVGYRAQSAILVNGHTDNQDDVLAKTVSGFALTKTFEERTLGSTRLQEGVVGMLSLEDQQRALQNVVVRGGKKGGLVIIVSEHTDSEVAEVLSMESTETLTRMSRLYIGGETEFTSTVIDKAILTKELIHKGLYTVKTGLTAVILFIVILLAEPLFSWIFAQMRKLTDTSFKKQAKEVQEEVGETLDQRFVPQKLDPAFLYPPAEAMPEHAAPLPKASEVVKSEVYGKSPLQSVSVSMEDLPFTFETPKAEHTEEAVVESTVKRDEPALPVEEAVSEKENEKEPTMLEYKRRLNELLAQK